MGPSGDESAKNHSDFEVSREVSCHRQASVTFFGSTNTPLVYKDHVHLSVGTVL